MNAVKILAAAAVATRALALAPTTLNDRVRVLAEPTLDDLDACAALMVDGFWPGGQRLNGAQREALRRAQRDDFRGRFGRDGARTLRGALLAARDAAGDVVAMASVEVGVVDVQRRSVLPRDEAEREMAAAVGRLSNRDRSALRRVSPKNLCAALLGDNARVAPLVANLAVLPAARRGGLGRDVLDACAATAGAWGFDELFLEVEAANAPAAALYDALGYQELWRSSRPALAVDVDIVDGRPPLRRRPDVDHVAMWRRL